MLDKILTDEETIKFIDDMIDSVKVIDYQIDQLQIKSGKMREKIKNAISKIDDVDVYQLLANNLG